MDSWLISLFNIIYQYIAVAFDHQNDKKLTLFFTNGKPVCFDRYPIAVADIPTACLSTNVKVSSLMSLFM